MRQDLNIRRAEARDHEAVKGLATSNDMFAPDEWDEGVAPSLDAFTSGEADDELWLVATHGDDVVGAAYLAPEPFADRVWNLLFIATDADGHGRGIGTALVTAVREHLTGLGEEHARVLLVETSSTAQYEGARAFYLGRGFDHEATIREYYGPGDDKVVFWAPLV